MSTADHQPYKLEKMEAQSVYDGADWYFGLSFKTDDGQQMRFQTECLERHDVIETVALALRTLAADLDNFRLKQMVLRKFDPHPGDEDEKEEKAKAVSD